MPFSMRHHFQFDMFLIIVPVRSDRDSVTGPGEDPLLRGPVPGKPAV